MKDEVFYSRAHYPRVSGGQGWYRARITRSKFNVVSRLGVFEPKGSAMLEVGCDAGVLLRMFEQAGATVYGIDLNADSVKAANHPRVSVARADAIPFQDGMFDGCISSHVIEHLEHPDAFVVEASRVLKSGGALILIYPWELFRGMTLIPDVLLNGKLPQPSLLQRMHRHLFTPAKIQALASGLPFEHVASRLFWGFPYISPQYITVFRKK